jgi:hypothetical protein
MRLGKRRKRVRMHLIEPNPGVTLPSVEGLLVARRDREYLLALPSLIVAEDAKPISLEAHLVAIPRERVAFFEVIG